jgi:hypothetical protein
MLSRGEFSENYDTNLNDRHFDLVSIFEIIFLNYFL